MTNSRFLTTLIALLIYNVFMVYIIAFDLSDYLIPQLILMFIVNVTIIWRFYVQYRKANNQVISDITALNDQNFQLFKTELGFREQLIQLQEKLTQSENRNENLQTQVEAYQKMQALNNEIEVAHRTKINILIDNIKLCHKLTKAKWYYDFWTDIKKQHEGILVKEDLDQPPTIPTSE